MNYRNTQIFKKCRELHELIVALVETWPRGHSDLADQLDRATRSVEYPGPSSFAFRTQRVSQLTNSTWLSSARGSSTITAYMQAYQSEVHEVPSKAALRLCCLKLSCLNPLLAERRVSLLLISSLARNLGSTHQEPHECNGLS